MEKQTEKKNKPIGDKWKNKPKRKQTEVIEKTEDLPKHAALKNSEYKTRNHSNQKDIIVNPTIPLLKNSNQKT